VEHSSERFLRSRALSTESVGCADHLVDENEDDRHHPHCQQRDRIEAAGRSLRAAGEAEPLKQLGVSMALIEASAGTPSATPKNE
jgi:hypothetical protein